MNTSATVNRTAPASHAPRSAPICGRAIVGPAAVDRAAFGLLGVEVRP